jgi:hypothetical protein
MTKFFLAIFAVAFFLTAHAEDKWLEFKYNENVVIRIANVVCPIKQLKKDYPNGAVAIRADGQYMFGCFTHKGDDIVIQWAGGDQSIFPANYFLMKPNV